MLFIFNFFSSGNLALCGAFSKLRADEWRTQLKVKVVTGIVLKCHMLAVMDFTKSDESANVVLFCKYSSESKSCNRNFFIVCATCWHSWISRSRMRVLMSSYFCFVNTKI